MRITAGRPLGVLAFCALLALPAPASARDLSDVPSAVRSGPTVVSSRGHFLVHYARRGSDAISASRARLLARYAERAWTTVIGRWGWPRPLRDGDGRSDVYVYRMVPAGQTTPDSSGGPATAWVAINPVYVNRVTMSHELLHVSQAAITGDYEGQALEEGLGYWAGFAATHNPYLPDWAAIEPIRPFGCTGLYSCVSGKWAFFQFLAERFGHRLLIDAYRRAADMTRDPEQRAAPAVDAALRARGSSLEEAHAAYVAAVTSGRFRLRVLRRMRPRPAFRSVLHCRADVSRALAVERLAARWADLASTCNDRDATVRISVRWPADSAGLRATLSTGAEVKGLHVAHGDGALSATVPATALSTDLWVGLSNARAGGGRASFRTNVVSRARRLARVRVLRRMRVVGGRARAVVVRVRASRRVWLGMGFPMGLDMESASLVRAPRGTHTLRIPVPGSALGGRRFVALRGALITGPYFGELRIPGRH